MSERVVVFDDQAIARSEPSTPFITDRRCWLPHPRGVCNGRLRTVALDTEPTNGLCSALLCDECGSVYDLHLEMLGTASAWDGDIMLADEDGEPRDPGLYYTGTTARDRLTEAYNAMVAQLARAGPREFEADVDGLPEYLYGAEARE